MSFPALLMVDRPPDSISVDRLARPGLFWWFRQVLSTGIAVFFVGFGIGLLRAAYTLKDPYSFIMTFFAASLMILISAVMVLAFVVRMRQAGRRRGEGNAPGPEGNRPL